MALSLLAAGRTAFILVRRSMRCLYVRANVSPMTYDVSLATMRIKLVLLSYQQSHGKSPTL